MEWTVGSYIKLTMPENLELMKKYSDDITSAGFLSGYINQENSFLAQQAGEIIKSLPDNIVSSTEYYAVGLALQNASDNESAKTFFLQAIKTADDVNEELSALRAYSNFLFVIGQPEAGRVEYQKAMNSFSKYSNHNEFTQKSSHILTELSWAYSEANISHINSAKQHVSNAESIVSTLPSSPGKKQWQNQIAQTKALFNTHKSLTIPSNPLLNAPLSSGLIDD